jgi:hypothetical protein
VKAIAIRACHKLFVLNNSAKASVEVLVLSDIEVFVMLGFRESNFRVEKEENPFFRLFFSVTI